MLLIMYLFILSLIVLPSAYGVGDCDSSCPQLELEFKVILNQYIDDQGTLRYDSETYDDDDDIFVQDFSIVEGFCPGHRNDAGGFWPYELDLGGVNEGAEHEFCEVGDGPVEARWILNYASQGDLTTKFGDDKSICEDLSQQEKTEWISLGFCRGGMYYSDGDSSESGCGAAINYLQRYDEFRESADGRAVEVGELYHWMGTCCGDKFDDPGRVFIDVHNNYKSFICTASEDGKFGWVDASPGTELGVYTVSNRDDFWVWGIDSAGNYLSVDDPDEMRRREKIAEGLSFNGVESGKQDYDSFSYVVATSGHGHIIACDPDGRWENTDTDFVETLASNDVWRYRNIGFACGQGYKLSARGDGRYESRKDDDLSQTVIALCQGRGENIEDKSGTSYNSLVLEPGEIFVNKFGEEDGREKLWYCTEQSGFVSHDSISEFRSIDYNPDTSCNPADVCCDADGNIKDVAVDSRCLSSCLVEKTVCTGEDSATTEIEYAVGNEAQVCHGGEFIDANEEHNIGVYYSYGANNCYADVYYMGCKGTIHYPDGPDSIPMGARAGNDASDCQDYATGGGVRNVPAGRVFTEGATCSQDFSIKVADEDDNRGERIASDSGFCRGTKYYLGCDGGGDDGTSCLRHRGTKGTYNAPYGKVLKSNECVSSGNVNLSTSSRDIGSTLRDRMPIHASRSTFTEEYEKEIEVQEGPFTTTETVTATRDYYRNTIHLCSGSGGPGPVHDTVEISGSYEDIKEAVLSGEHRDSFCYDNWCTKSTYSEYNFEVNRDSAETTEEKDAITRFFQQLYLGYYWESRKSDD